MKSFLRKATSKGFAIALYIVLIFPAAGLASARSHLVSFGESDNQVTLSNDYLEMVFDRTNHRISRLAADHTGSHIFGINLLASDGVCFDDGSAAGKVRSRVEVLESRPERVTLRVTSMPIVTEHRDTAELTITIGATDRGVGVHAIFTASRKSIAVRSVRVALRQWFLLGLFDRGVVQYIAGQRQAFTSRGRLRLFYTLDRENGSVAIVPDEKTDLLETTLFSGDSSAPSAIELRPQISRVPIDAWSADAAIHPVSSSPAEKQTIAFHIYANDLPFPAHRSENRIEGNDKAVRDSARRFVKRVLP